MVDRLDHPGGCGCGVCRRRRDAVASDPWAAEVDATSRDDGGHATSGPDTERPAAAGEPVTVEEHHHETTVVHEHQHHTTEKHQHQHGGGRERGRSDRRFARRRHRHRPQRGGVLRTLVVLLVAVWVVHSFYPQLNVPLVPGVACTTPTGPPAGGSGQVRQAGVYVPGPNLTPPPGTPGGVPNPVPKVGDLLADTAGHAVKTVALMGAAAVLHTVGSTVRAMIAARPSPADIRAGLVGDVHTVGAVAGFVVGGIAGRPVGPAPNVAQGNGDGSGVGAVAPVCGQCPGVVVPAATGALDGARVAARAVLRAGTDWDPVTAVAIAGAESGWVHDSHNPVTDSAGNSAYGMWQTMLPMHAHLYAAGSSWSDPYANARVAHQLWAQAGGWGPWVSSRANWGKHMAAARAAVAAVTSGSRQPQIRPAAFTTPSSDHLQPVTRRAERFIRHQLGFLGTIGGYNYRFIAGTHTLSEHAKGLALDMMTSSRATGDPIAAYFSGPGAASWGVHNVIWQDRIWTSEGQRWKSYGDHGNATLNHMDHVHVDFHPAGGGGDVPADVGGGC